MYHPILSYESVCFFEIIIVMLRVSISSKFSILYFLNIIPFSRNALLFVLCPYNSGILYYVLICFSCFQWVMIDQGAVMFSIVLVPLYVTLGVEGLNHILNQSKSISVGFYLGVGRNTVSFIFLVFCLLSHERVL